jgi:enoyl-CoA hydratase/carnithine racemase
MGERTSLLVERSDDGVVAIWLNRPARRNALDHDLVSGLFEAFQDDGARAFVLGSSEPPAFCAGADLDIPDDDRARLSDRLYELYGVMLAGPPIVAVVDGPAVGGGAQLAIASDLRIGGAGATFRFVGAGHGLAIGSWGLPGLVGRGRALDLCLTMRPVGAEEALLIGLLDRLEDDPRRIALDLAAQFAASDADAVARVKSVVLESDGALAALAREREENRAAWSGAVGPLRG